VILSGVSERIGASLRELALGAWRLARERKGEIEKENRDNAALAGDWRLETGDWRLATGDWRLATGDWRL